MGYELRATKDKSFTLFSKTYKECYHSVKDGAFNEALKKHVQPAFWLVKKEEVKVLDICFGLGINSLTTLYYLPQTNLKKLTIYSPELDEKLLSLLPNFNYPPQLIPFKDYLLPLLERGKHSFKLGSTQVELELFRGDAREYIRTLKGIDIIYQDPFSPKKNPLLWSLEYFQQLYKLLTPNGVITTYSIASPVRLGLGEAGFRVYKFKNEGVREGTIASKAKLTHPNLKEIDIAKKRLTSTSKVIRDKENGEDDG